VQDVAPAAALVTEPGAQLWHALFGSVPNLPAAHLEQLFAPALLSVSVTEPGAQLWHARFGSEPNLPASHLEQLFAPVLFSVLVTEPDLHDLQRCASFAAK
jgi:hypothetical protein